MFSAAHNGWAEERTMNTTLQPLQLLPLLLLLLLLLFTWGYPVRPGGGAGAPEAPTEEGKYVRRHITAHAVLLRRAICELPGCSLYGAALRGLCSLGA